VRALENFHFKKSGSGAVIASRWVITVAHCVHGGLLVGFYDDFVFIPAY